jgi:hypothetical protein
VRQETRRLGEAQNEMQTLRNRLTVAESRLAEKTVEIDKLMEENAILKDTMDRINQHKMMKPDHSKYIFLHFTFFRFATARQIFSSIFEVLTTFSLLLIKKTHLTRKRLKD